MLSVVLETYNTYLLSLVDKIQSKEFYVLEDCMDSESLEEVSTKLLSNIPLNTLLAIQIKTDGGTKLAILNGDYLLKIKESAEKFNEPYIRRKIMESHVNLFYLSSYSTLTSKIFFFNRILKLKT